MEFNSDSSEYHTPHSLPPKYKEELDLILENAEHIHGENFAAHIKFINNLKSLVGLMMTNVILKEDVDKTKFSKVLASVCSELTMSHAMCAGLTPDLDNEAHQVTKAMDSIVEAYANEKFPNRRKRK